VRGECPLRTGGTKERKKKVKTYAESVGPEKVREIIKVAIVKHGVLAKLNNGVIGKFYPEIR